MFRRSWRGLSYNLEPRCVRVRDWLKSRMSGDRLRGIRYVSPLTVFFPVQTSRCYRKRGRLFRLLLKRIFIYHLAIWCVAWRYCFVCLCFWEKAGLAGGGVIRGTFSERLSLGPTWLFGCGSKLPWPSDSRGLRALVCVPCTLHPNTTLN